MTREEAIERFENVKANALVQKASGVSEYWQNEIDGTIEAIDMAIEALKDRPQGEWIDYTDDGYVECPFCHNATNCDDNKEELHFCFSCGAYMRGDDE